MCKRISDATSTRTNQVKPDHVDANKVRVLLLILASLFLLHVMEDTDPTLVGRGIRMKEEESATLCGTTNNPTRSIPDVAVSPTTAAPGSQPTTQSVNAATEVKAFQFADTCRRIPWTENCVEWYNTGKWTVLPSPLKWNQTYSQAKRYWKATNITSSLECHRVGTTLMWQSATHEPPVWDAHQFLKALGPHKRIALVGDSVTRQHYATFLEALGDTIQSCSGFHHGWGPRTPRSCQTNTNVTIHLVPDNFGSWDEGIDFWDGGVRGKSYNGTMATQDFFRESHLIVMNFGLWYHEQGQIGQQTNHTPSSYLRHMRALADAVAMYRQPDQLVVWRETTVSGLADHPDRILRPYMAHRQIPVIYDHSVQHLLGHHPAADGSTTTTTTVADLYMDNIHFCEPALQCAWTSILSHLVQDYWSTGRHS
jgi:hypothetical protein